MSRLFLEVNNLSKRFCQNPKLSMKYATQDLMGDLACSDDRNRLRPGEFWAIRNVDLRVAEGEVVGIIGHNGAGKSTLINLVSGILRPTVGEVVIHTDKIALMDYQGGLNPVQTGLENVGNQLSLHGFDEHRIAELMDDIIAYSDLGDFIHAPVGTYSLGMKVRLAFSIYTRLKPDLFIVDEALNGGDLKFRMKFQRFLNEYIAQGGSILLASHDMFTVQTLCHRCILMERGQIHAVGTPDEIIHEYMSLAGAKNSDAMPAPTLPDAFDPLTDGNENEASADTRTEPAPTGFLDVVTIESMEITGPDSGELIPGGAANIRIVCHSREEVSPILWGMEFGAAGIFPIASPGTGYGETICCLKRGRNEFRCEILSLPLLPGVYQMAVSFINRPDGVVLGFKGYIDSPFKFEVKSVTDQSQNIALHRKSFVHMPIRWE